MTLEAMTFPGALSILSLAMALAFIRLMRGPSLPDRVIALDLIATLAVGMIVLYAMAIDQPILLDVALALALLSFLGTVAFARYLERSYRP